MIRYRLVQLLATLAIAGLHGGYCTTARAAEIVVTTTAWKGVSECTLRDAITAANSDLPAGGCPAGSGPDTIVLAPGATYFLQTVDNTTVDNEIVQPNGLPVVTGVLTIVGNGATIARGIPNSPLPTSGGTPAFRFLHVAPSGVLTLSGLTLTGGLAPATLNVEGFRESVSGGDGGAIFNEGILVLIHVQLIANQAGTSGGAIYNTAGAFLVLAESALSNNELNEAALGGGALTNDGFASVSQTVLTGNFGDDAGVIHNTGSLSLDHCAVTANQATGLDNLGLATVVDSTFSDNDCGDSNYGAIQNEASGTLSVTNCLIAENNAEITGGITNFGTASITNSTLRDNVGSSGGGSDGAVTNFAGTMKLTGCTVTGNFGFWDGGIGNGLNGVMELANCTLSANSGGDAGGAIGNGGTLTMTNCTIAGNDTTSGAGGFDNSGTEVIDNCIIADNTSVVGPGNCAVPILATGHNLTTDDTCGLSPDLVVADAGLAPLGSYGGPTQTMALCTAAGVPDASCTGPSPAIDAGDPEICGLPPVSGLDQRGFARPGMGHTRCSLGAFEPDSVPAQVCVGDCSGTAKVAISDLVTLVNVALGSALPAACAYGVPSGSDVSVALLVQAVNNALAGCPLG